jgi:hypothetical protein
MDRVAAYREKAQAMSNDLLRNQLQVFMVIVGPDSDFYDRARLEVLCREAENRKQKI